MKYDPSEIYLTGVTGGRLDHFEAAIRSMYRFQMLNQKTKIKL